MQTKGIRKKVIVVTFIFGNIYLCPPGRMTSLSHYLNLTSLPVLFYLYIIFSFFFLFLLNWNRPHKTFIYLLCCFFCSALLHFVLLFCSYFSWSCHTDCKLFVVLCVISKRKKNTQTHTHIHISTLTQKDEIRVNGQLEECESFSLEILAL